MHQEAITSEIKNVLDELSIPDGFYLAGGTALAMQIGNRLSYDLDFLNPRQIKAGTLSDIESRLGQKASEVLINNPDQLTMRVSGVKLTFLHYPFPLLLPLKEFHGMPVADVPEIAAMKAYTIGRRGTLKDYVDLFFIVDGGLPIRKIIEMSFQKFGEVFNDRLFLEQLVYLKDIPPEEITFLSRKVSKEEIEKFFKEKIAMEFGMEQ